MIKRILVLLILFVMLFPAMAGANDGGYVVDDEELLKIKFIPLTREVNIGGAFEFRLELTNNSSSIIDHFEFDNIIDKLSTSIYDDIDAVFDNDFNILPGKKAIMDFSLKVPYSIDWYKVGSKFFFDIDIRLKYEFRDYDNKRHEEGLPYYGHINEESITSSVRILNLHDGKDKITLEDNDQIIGYECDPDYKYYYTEVTNEVSFCNIANNMVSILFMRSETYHDYDEEQEIIKLSRGEVYSETFRINGTEIYEDIQETTDIEYKILFEYEGKLYAHSETLTYYTLFIECPKLDSKLYHNGNGTFIIELQNNSSSNYSNFYFGYDDPGSSSSRYSSIQSKYLIDNFLVGDKLNIDCSKEFRTSRIKEFYIGFEYNDILYIWGAFFNKDFTEYYSVFSDEISIVDTVRFVADTNELEPSPSPIPDPTPTPSPTPTMTPSPTATPYTIQSPTQRVPDVSPKPLNQPTIKITNIETKSSIPIWVWIVLPVALVGAVVLIMVFRKKNSLE